MCSIGTTNEQTQVRIKAEVECKKKIWGVSGLVENMLEKQVQSSLSLWLQMVREHLNNHPPTSLQTTESNHKTSPTHSSNHILSVPSSPRASKRQNEFTRGGTRLRLSTFKRVVNGTEKLKQMLSSTSLEDVSQASNQQSILPTNSNHSQTSASSFQENFSDFDPCGPLLPEIVVQTIPIQDHRDDDEVRASTYRTRRWKGRGVLLLCILLPILLYLYISFNNYHQS